MVDDHFCKFDEHYKEFEEFLIVFLSSPSIPLSDIIKSYKNTLYEQLATTDKAVGRFVQKTLRCLIVG